MANTLKLQLPLLLSNQAQKDVTVNQALTQLDALVQLSVKSRVVATPPANPSNEDAYIVPAGATGVWTGQTNNVAIFLNSTGGWVFLVPAVGWQAWSQADAGMYIFANGAWGISSGGAPIGPNAVTNAMLAQAPANTIKGNGTAGTANVADLTTLPTAVMPALTGDITNPAGSLATTIAANVVTSAKFRQSAALSVVGNATGVTANVADIVGTANTLLGVNAAGNAVAFAQATVPQGGTGRITLTANGILIGEGTAGVNSMGAGTAGQVVKSAGAGVDPGFQDDLATITYVIGDGVNAVSTGIKGYLEIPFACTIIRSTLLADASGSAVVDVFKCSFANFDASATHPVAADKITASAPPTISAATKAQDSTLTGWTTAITSGDILAFNVNSAATVKRLTLSLRVRKS